jgi:two-component system, response regulator FlrC
MVRTNIVVADDDADTRALVKAALVGFEVFEACNGIELLEVLADAVRCDLIVTDVDMGWLDGIQAVANARTAGLRTPIVVITGIAGAGVAERVARIPGAFLLRKPFSIAELIALVAHLTGGPGGRQPEGN